MIIVQFDILYQEGTNNIILEVVPKNRVCMPKIIP